MANLKLCYADAQVRASTISSPGSDVVKTTDTFPIGNTRCGARHRHYRRDTAAIQTNIDYDMGAGVTINPDYLILARGDFLIRGDSGDPDIYLQGDDNSGFSSPETKTHNFDSADLFGTHSEDTIYETSGYTTAYRYWRVSLNTTASFQHEVSKIYFGNWLDLDRDPSYPPSIDFGEWNHSKRRKARIITLNWRGITTANRLLFDQKVVENKDVYPLFLYDKNDYLFNGIRLLHCELLSHGWTIRHGGSDLSATFRELI